MNPPKAKTQFAKHVSRRGQAAVEYVLLVALSTLIFGAMFNSMRQNIYKLWVCEIGPRVQSPGGCGGSHETSNCWKAIGNAPGFAGQAAQFCTQ